LEKCEECGTELADKEHFERHKKIHENRSKAPDAGGNESEAEHLSVPRSEL
jgi:hypothetical protein